MRALLDVLAFIIGIVGAIITAFIIEYVGRPANQTELDQQQAKEASEWLEQRAKDEEYEQQRLATIVNHAWWRENGYSYVVWVVCLTGVLSIIAYKLVF